MYSASPAHSQAEEVVHAECRAQSPRAGHNPRTGEKESAPMRETHTGTRRWHLRVFRVVPIRRSNRHKVLAPTSAPESWHDEHPPTQRSHSKHGQRNTKASEANPSKLKHREATHASDSNVRGSYATMGRLAVGPRHKRTSITVLRELRKIPIL